MHLTLLLALGSTALVAGQQSSAASSARVSSSTARSASPTGGASPTVAGGAVTVPGSSPLPLQSAVYTYPNLVNRIFPILTTNLAESFLRDQPYQVNPFAVGRGPQSGFNLCNEVSKSRPFKKQPQAPR